MNICFFIHSHLLPYIFQATVPDLTKGQEYEFRIIAVNSAGPSAPSEPSDPVVCKKRYCKTYKYTLNKLLLLF